MAMVVAMLFNQFLLILPFENGIMNDDIIGIFKERGLEGIFPGYSATLRRDHKAELTE